MDVFSKKKRSEIMSHIKGKNTSPERMVFAELRKRKIRYVRHYSKVPGTPDIAIPSNRIAVFIEGRFWHGWGFDRVKTHLSPFWRRKIETNRRRDKRNLRTLRKLGWKTMRVWDHRLNKNPDFWLQKISDFLSDKKFTIRKERKK